MFLLWGPKWLQTHFHHLGIYFQLHRTSVTQGFLAEIIMCDSGASIRYFMCTCQLYTLIVWELHFSDYAHICYTKELFPNYLCIHFGPHSTLTPLNSFLKFVSGCNSSFANVMLNFGYTPSITLTLFNFSELIARKNALTLTLTPFFCFELVRSARYPLTRNYCENHSLRIIFGSFFQTFAPSNF